MSNAQQAVVCGDWTYAIHAHNNLLEQGIETCGVLRFADNSRNSTCLPHATPKLRCMMLIV
jgi:hypothetical protein